MKFIYIFPVLVMLAFAISCEEVLDKEPEIKLNDSTLSQVMFAKEFKDSSYTPYDTLMANGAVHITLRDISYVIGYYNSGKRNRTPILAKYRLTAKKDNYGNTIHEWKLQWFRKDYELTSDNCSGYGLIWDKKDIMYAVFSTKGMRGEPSEDFRRYTEYGWLTDYGQGDGAQASIIAKLDPSDEGKGKVIAATYLYSVLKSGNTNHLKVTEMNLDTDNNLIINADSWYAPLNVDKIPFNCGGATPFNYSITFNSDLNLALDASVECL